MRPFNATIAILGINPYVRVPRAHLNALFEAAGREKGPIPVRGTLNGWAFAQTLVKYQGAWRLYLNTPMRRATRTEVGDRVEVSVAFDPAPRVEKVPTKLRSALAKNAPARAAFGALTASRRKEILRYLNSMKTEASLERNVAIVVRHLAGGPPKGLAGVLRANRRAP